MPVSPAALRNRDPILNILRTVLPDKGTVLETNSGDGTHAVHFAAAFPALLWRPSDISPQARERLAMLSQDSQLEQGNLLAPLDLDVAQPVWPIEAADAIVSINMIHIAPWAACEGLFAGAARILPKGGTLYLYGPFIIDQRPTAAGNLAFDADLKSRNPDWGVRNLRNVDAAAAQCGLARTDLIDMPANNYSVIYKIQPPHA